MRSVPGSHPGNAEPPDRDIVGPNIAFCATTTATTNTTKTKPTRK